ncbi:MAG TPA: PAS domain-containing sensor histidine kinase [Hanamia sp.]|nr:PAS domain-containing sensor histidine kinase [Hanamia sp.]
MNDIKRPKKLSEIEELRQKLDEANETIEAIRSGQVDAFLVKDQNGPRIYTLKSADQTYRVFIEKMKEGAITLNKEGIILYSNSRFASMMGLPLPKIIGSYFKSFVPSEMNDKIQVIIDNGWKGESKGEIFLITGDAEYIPFLISSARLELDEGTALSLILTDLSVQKNTEQELKEMNDLLKSAQQFTDQLNNELELKVNERTKELLTSREHFKFLATSIPAIVWTALPNGDYDYLNQQWYDYTGLKYEESIGSGWLSVIHPDDVNHSLALWNKSLVTGVPFKTEDRKLSAKGVYRWFVAHALPVRDHDQKIIGWCGVCTDIEDQKSDMEKKDEFISMASHELKTPVTSLRAYTQILMMSLEKGESTGALQLLTKMDMQIEKLTRLIGDLLDASKTSSGQLNFYYEKIDFNAMVNEVINVMQLSAGSHKIVLDLADTIIIDGDRNRLGQVVINLISNAIKYSPAADRIIVSSVNHDDKITLSVQDFGIGVPLSDQLKLFSRFFRASESTYPGLGLGLYICNEIIKRHSGKMEFESVVGKGSTFCFTIPVAQKSSL